MRLITGEINASIGVNLGRRVPLKKLEPLRRSLALEEGNNLALARRAGADQEALKSRFAHVQRDRALVGELIAERRKQISIED